MKKSFIKKSLAFVLVLTLFLSLFITNSYATTNHLSASDDEATVLSWKDKIDKKIIKEFNSLKDEEKIPVWVWFFDLPENTIEDKVQEKTGLTLDKLSVKRKDPSEKTEKMLAGVSNIENIQNINQKTKNEIKLYFERIKTERAKEKKQTDIYLKTKRSIAKELFSKYNSSIINRLDIDSKDVLFKSCLTPSCILSLTKEQVYNIAKDNAVQSLDYSRISASDVVPPDEVPPESDLSELCAEPKKVMNVDSVQQLYGLNGDNVNVLVVDHGWIRPSQAYYEQLNTSNIKNLYKKHLYDTDNEQILPYNYVVLHSNITVGELQKYVPNVNIICASTPFQYSEYNNITEDMSETFKDLEWAIVNQNVNAQIIDASCCLSTEQSYTEISKWFDALVETCNIAVIASAGNTQGQHPHVIAPANAYNTIGIGAFYTNGIAVQDYRRNYVYKPTNSNDEINYKPDMVVAAGSTSEAAPTLTGIATMLIEYDPSLAAKPELLKAILMASCHRKVNQYPYSSDPPELIESGLTQKQGSGAVDAFIALSILIKGNYETGTISSSSITSSSFNIKKTVPTNVSLVWLRNNTLPSTVYDYSNTTLGAQQELKLEVVKNNNVITSSEKTNTYKQMVYFNNEVENSNYTIRITKTEGDENTRYAYAWSSKEQMVMLHTDNEVGEISRSEIGSQLAGAGISSNSNVPFYVCFDSSVNAIGNQAFRWYDNLSGVYINYGITKVCNGAFRDCNSLTEVEIPSGLLTIEDNAFRNCSSLSKVIIGDSVRSIGENAFYSCSSLSNVEFLKYIAPTIRDNAFSGIANNAKGHITPLAVGYANSYGDLEIVHNTNIKTIYFTNNKNWNNLYAYVWKGNVSYYNQTIPLQYSYMNHYGQNVYSLTVDTNQYDMIKFIGDNGNHRTVAIEIGTNGIEYYTTSGNANNEYNVSTYMPDVRTIYFTNSNNWTDVRAYLWKAGTSQNNIWHGLPMTYSFTNDYSQDVYSINIDYNEYDCVVFNDFNSNNQTVDINIGSSGIGYYLTGNKVGNKWMVDTIYI